jgi:hypothetical protein
VWGSGPADVYAVGANGTVLHYDGTRWSTVNLGITGDLTGVSGTGPNDVFIAGRLAGTFRFNGTGWDPIRTPNARPGSVWSHPLAVFLVGEVVYAGVSGLILVRTVPSAP